MFAADLDGFEAARSPLAGGPGRALYGAAAALGRLDARLAVAPDAVRAGWLNRMIEEEAAASSKLSEIPVEPDELRLHRMGALGADEGRAVHGVDRLHLADGIWRLLRSVTRRDPETLFTPSGLMAAARLRLKGRPGEIKAEERLPRFLVDVPDPAAARAALRAALTPAAMEGWLDLPPPLATANFLARWTDTGCANAVGGHVGRALVPLLLARLHATSGPILFPSIGFLRHAYAYRPDLLARDEEWAVVAWLDACRRSAERGLGVLARVSEAHGRLHAALKPERKTGRGAVVADLLTVETVVTGATVAAALGMSKVAARTMLDRAHSAGAIRPLLVRDAFRVYGY